MRKVVFYLKITLILLIVNICTYGRKLEHRRTNICTYGRKLEHRRTTVRTQRT